LTCESTNLRASLDRQYIYRGKVRPEATTVESDAAWNSDVEVEEWEERDEASGGDTSGEDKPKTKQKRKQSSRRHEKQTHAERYH
jgi:hypothetical protein